jgi:hypothetical protein
MACFGVLSRLADTMDGIYDVLRYNVSVPPSFLQRADPYSQIFLPLSEMSLRILQWGLRGAFGLLQCFEKTAWCWRIAFTA